MLQKEKVLEEIIRVAEMNLHIVRMFKPAECTKCDCDYCKQSEDLPDMLWIILLVSFCTQFILLHIVKVRSDYSGIGGSSLNIE